MSVFTIRSTLAGFFLAASPANVPAQEPAPVSPDVVQELVSLCTEHKNNVERFIAPTLEIGGPDKDLLALRNYYKDKNQSYAEILSGGGYDPAPCLNLN